MHISHSEYPKGAAFRDGLHNALMACSRVLCSRNYLDYLRLAFDGGDRELLQLAIHTGHGGLRDLVRAYLEEGARSGIIREIDFNAEAERLLAQAQGFDFLYALLCERGTQPDQWRGRIDAAVSAFCVAHIVR